MSNHVDTVWPYWNLMDFTPEGRPDIPTPPQNVQVRVPGKALFEQAVAPSRSRAAPGSQEWTDGAAQRRTAAVREGRQMAGTRSARSAYTPRGARGALVDYGFTQVKEAAALMSPVPLYRAHLG